MRSEKNNQPPDSIFYNSSVKCAENPHVDKPVISYTYDVMRFQFTFRQK